MDATDATAGGFEPTAVDLRDYVTFREEAPAAARVFSTDVVAMDLIGLEPQQVVAARTLPTGDAIYTVIGGRAWVVTDEAEVTLEPLQSVLVPAGVPHGLRNDGADPLLLQVVVSPPDDVPLPAARVRDGTVGASRRPGLLDRARRLLGG